MQSRCYLCGSDDSTVIHKGTRNIQNVDVLMCSYCGLIFLSSFDHIGDKFYPNAEMHNETMDEWIRSTNPDDMRRIKYIVENFRFPQFANVLDFGAGNCNFLMALRRIRPHWNLMAVEPEDRVRKEISEYLAKNLIVLLDSVCNCDLDLVTIFHTLEHLKDPIGVLSEIHDRMSDDGVICVEVPNANDAMISLYNCEEYKKYSYWECHLYTFNESTLESIARKAGFTCQISQIQRYPLSNHLYWLANGELGGHEKFGFMNSPIINDEYSKMLQNLGMCDTLFAVLRKDD